MEQEQYAILVRYLREAPTYTRPPQGLKTSYVSVSEEQTDPKSTSRIFLEAGFQSWLAHFIAARNVTGGKHFDGKKSQQELLSDLDETSDSLRRTLARRIASEKFDATLERRVRDWEELCKGNKPKKTGPKMLTAPKHADGESLTAANNTPHADASGEVEDSLPENPQQLSSNTQEQVSNSRRETLPNDQGLLHNDTIHNQPLGAAISGVINLFPSYICSAIVKDHASSMAMIEMQFPHYLPDDCHMTLTIQPNKIEYLAMALFGIHLESEGGHRYVILGDGARVVPLHQLSLDGADDAAFVTIFGAAVSDAIQGSWKRTLELATAKRRTGCVSLEVSTKANETARLALWLSLEKAFGLRQILFA